MPKKIEAKQAESRLGSNPKSALEPNVPERMYHLPAQCFHGGGTRGPGSRACQSCCDGAACCRHIDSSIFSGPPVQLGQHRV
jgi:hypothetical protein